jgi:mRNA interferase MazF
MGRFVKGDVVVVPFPFSDFVSGDLHKPSNISPNRLFTADRHIVLYKTGSLNKEKADVVIDTLVGILKKYCRVEK